MMCQLCLNVQSVPVLPTKSSNQCCWGSTPGLRPNQCTKNDINIKNIYFLKLTILKNVISLFISMQFILVNWNKITNYNVISFIIFATQEFIYSCNIALRSRISLNLLPSPALYCLSVGGDSRVRGNSNQWSKSLLVNCYSNNHYSKVVSVSFK